MGCGLSLIGSWRESRRNAGRGLEQSGLRPADVLSLRQRIDIGAPWPVKPFRSRPSDATAPTGEKAPSFGLGAA